MMWELGKHWDIPAQCKFNKAIRDGRPRPPRHQGFIAISYGGSELRHRSILETITHRPKVVGIIFPYILTPIPNLYDHSFPRYGQITFLTFRWPTTLTFDLQFWKYLSVTVYPYVICMPSFIMIGWEMAEILHIEILRKHGQTNTHTNRQTDRHGHYNTSPSPYGGRGNDVIRRSGDLIFFPKSNILCDLQSHTPQIYMYVLIIHTEDKSFLDYDSWSKKSLKKMYINWSHDAQITSSILVPQKCHHGYFEVVQLCAKFRG